MLCLFILLKTDKNTCISSKTAPLLAVRKFTKFPNTFVKEA
jgi:hypothetical protein